MKKILKIILLTMIASPVNADIYKVFWPTTDTKGSPAYNAVKIVNISSNTVLDGSLAGVHNQDLSALKAAASAANSNMTYLMERGLSQVDDGPTVINFSGTEITFRAHRGIQMNPLHGGTGAPAYIYDVVYKVDASTGKLLESRLVASTTGDAAIADKAGFTVDLEKSELNNSGKSTTFQTYASNVTNSNEGTVNIQTKGGLITEQLSNPDGTSLLRKEDDGTVHIGQNSIVLSDELVSESGNDEIYSSSNVLQLGNTDKHKTIIKGTLEVPTPTQNNHAANKKYVDSADAATLSSANTYADTVGASTLLSANTYSNAVGAMSQATSQISLNVDPKAKLSLGIGLGTMDGQNAFAIGLTGFEEQSGVRYSTTMSYSDTTKNVAVGAGLSWSLW
ncbi:YadA C-terminal domain-containing protein [Amylibacter sp.]|nr:YadA C-terminal domain-containing protein [Amylibacter sp.]